jgi:hypothetical protein
VSTKKKKSKAWMDDGDDAHFDGNPAYKPHHARKRIAGRTHGGVHKQGMSTVGGRKRTVKKRVAGK